jgi:chromosome segregation ATPase
LRSKLKDYVEKVDWERQNAQVEKELENQEDQHNKLKEATDDKIKKANLDIETCTTNIEDLQVQTNKLEKKAIDIQDEIDKNKEAIMSNFLKTEDLNEKSEDHEKRIKALEDVINKLKAFKKEIEDKVADKVDCEQFDQEINFIKNLIR